MGSFAFCLIGATSLQDVQILLIFALAMAAAYATELGYHGYNNYYGHHSGYSNSYDLYNYGYDGYNNYGYNSYNPYGVNHHLHKRSPTIFLPPLIASLGGNFIKGGVKKAALFPIGK